MPRHDRLAQENDAVKPRDIAARHAARLAAVQALFQMEQAGLSAAAAAEEVRLGRLPVEEEDGAYDGEVDLELFRAILGAAVAQQGEIDTLIASALAEGWRLDRLDAVARAILRAGTAELWARPDVPKAATIDEYVTIANAFFDKPEPAFINAALDACARAVRPEPTEGGA
jgi:N utilization substance protein B